MNRTSRPSYARPEAGFLLIPVIILTVVVAGVSFSMLTDQMGETRAVRLVETRTRALEIAEVGLVHAETELRTDVDSGGDGVGFVSGSFAGGHFDVDAAQDPTDIALWTLTATGSHESSVRRIEVVVRLPIRNMFPFGLFGRDELLVEGDVETDSWDSALGNYTSQQNNNDADGAYALAGGDIGSNGPVTIEGTSAVVRGDARAGPTHSVTTVGHPRITGTTNSLPLALELPDPPIEEFQEALISNDNADLAAFPGYNPATYELLIDAHDAVTLAGGTYFFTNVTVKDQGKLRVTGPSRIYVTGRFHVLNGGGMWNQSLSPPDLLVFVHPHPIPVGFQWTPPTKGGAIKEQVVVSGGAKAALGVYAPAADIRFIGNAAVWGSLIGRKLIVRGNPEFHYDVALQHAEGIFGRQPERIYWLERGPLRR